MNWGLIILSIGVFNGFMLSILFLRKNHYNYYLSLFFLVHCLALLKYAGHFIHTFDSDYGILGISVLLEWLAPPFLYFYLRKYNRKRIHRKYLHYLPFLFYMPVLFLAHFYKFPGPGSFFFPVSFYGSGLNLWIILKFVQGFVYIFVSWNERTTSDWLRLLVTLYLAEMLAMILLYLGLLFPLISLQEEHIPTIQGVFVTLIVFSAVGRSPVFTLPPLLNTEKSANFTDRTFSEKIFRKIREFTESEKIYLNQNVKVSDLAGPLSLNEKQVSQAINEISGENFSSFINGYRIQLAEVLLMDKSFRKYTIDAIAGECGFSNKVSFYKAFKKIHGKSPKEYKRALTTDKQIPLSSFLLFLLTNVLLHKYSGLLTYPLDFQ